MRSRARVSLSKKGSGSTLPSGLSCGGEGNVRKVKGIPGVWRETDGSGENIRRVEGI